LELRKCHICNTPSCACVINKYSKTCGECTIASLRVFFFFSVLIFFLLFSLFYFLFIFLFSPHIFFRFFPHIFLGFAYFFFFFFPLYVSINRGLFFKPTSYRLKPKILAYVLRLCTTTVRVRTGAYTEALVLAPSK